MIVRNRLLNYTDSYIFQDTDYFKFSLDSVLLANFVSINKRDKMILDIATGNAPIPMLLSFRKYMVLKFKKLFITWGLFLSMKII